MSARLYIWQRSTAVLLLLLIAVHLSVIFYATSKQLTAGDILERTHGSLVWALFYGTFVCAASIHSSIGLRTILIEWASLSRRSAKVLAACFGTLLFVIGLRAVAAVVLS